MNFRMIQAVIKCFERSTIERIEKNSNDVSLCLFYLQSARIKESGAPLVITITSLYDNVNKYT